MEDFSWLSRTELITGRDGLITLSKKNVLVVGMGGVGSFAAEFIVRAGIGKMTIVDGDAVEASNRNRQLPALSTTEGLLKTEIMRERLMAINPELELEVISRFLSPDDTRAIVQLPFDYIVDCIDSITPKATLILEAKRAKKNVVSSMGAGGKIDPTLIRVADLKETHTCRLALTVRKRLKQFGLRKGVKTVFSLENPIRHSLMHTDGTRYKKSAYGTISYLPAAFGGVCASVVIRDLLKSKS